MKHFQKPKWWDDELENATQLRDQLKSKGLEVEAKKQRNKVTSMKRLKRNEYFRTLITSNNNSKELWRAINELTKNKSKNHNSPTSDLSCDDFNKHFTDIPIKVIKNDKTNSNDLKPLRSYCSEKNIQSKSNLPLMTINDVYKELNQLKQSNTKGIDGVDGKILKLSASIITGSLTYIYNLCLSNKTFPDILKQAKVVPVYKKSGNVSDPNNYRPISILPVLSKPIEKHISKHTMEHFLKNDLLHQNQSGFRPNHSCHTALVKLVDQWLENIDQNEYTGVLLVDFAKAFDVIDRNLLIKKLNLYNINDNHLDLIKSFLSNRQQSVYYNNKFSCMLPLNYGVPQGSNLGPILFSIYINDLPLYIKNKCDLFADDTTIHTSNKKLQTISTQLQLNVNELLQWSELNHMALNPSKTKRMLITTRQRRQNIKEELKDINVYNITINNTESHKLLGVIIDDNLSWSPHVSNLCKKVSSKIYALNRIKHVLNIKCRKLYFQTYIQSLIDYASTLWDGASNETIRHLRSLHKRGLKTVFSKNKITSDDYKQHNILPFKERLNLNKATLLHKCIHGHAPKSLATRFSLKCMRNTYNLHTKTPRIDLSKTSFSYSGAKLWNSIADDIRTIGSLPNFKKRYKKELIENFSM